MRKVTLLFFSISNLADFVIKHKVKGALVDSGEKTLSAVLSEEELQIALEEYGAKVKRLLVGSFAE